ncbi:hypothetical protein M885DRAFT_572372 [Pelagophyceae sp. CCMP2097]|nr:hypothetical protein M885DRAFT_572372 [Pelagophyceae sp. CCMP2097]
MQHIFDNSISRTSSGSSIAAVISDQGQTWRETQSNNQPDNFGYLLDNFESDRDLMHEAPPQSSQFPVMLTVVQSPRQAPAQPALECLVTLGQQTPAIPRSYYQWPNEHTTTTFDPQPSPLSTDLRRLTETGTMIKERLMTVPVYQFELADEYNMDLKRRSVLEKVGTSYPCQPSEIQFNKLLELEKF